MDLLAIKQRIALAVVESIFRRAGFTLEPAIRREVPPHLGREDLPDFEVRRTVPDGGVGIEPRRLVEVRYRLDLAHYLAIETQRGARSMFAQAKRQWPELLFVFVTDHPRTTRSCFQVLDLARWRPGTPLAASEFWSHAELAIYRQNVEEHEVLLRRIFALVTGSP